MCFSLGAGDRQRFVDGRLQISPEPEVMSPPSSPRLRHSTFGATLDFIEALCDASSGLTAFATVSLPAHKRWLLCQAVLVVFLVGLLLRSESGPTLLCVSLFMLCGILMQSSSFHVEVLSNFVGLTSATEFACAGTKPVN